MIVNSKFINILFYGAAFHLGMRRGPYLVTFLPTLRCNARCQGCDIWRIDKSNDEMTFEEIKSVFDQLTDLKVVKITGGEPFIRRDLPDILNYLLNERKILVQVTSNGFLTDQIRRTVQELASPMLHVCISLDGIREFVDTKRGIPGYYDSVIKTLGALAKIRKKKKFYIAVNQTVFNHATTQIKALLPVLRDIGIENIHYTMEHNLFNRSASEKDIKNYWKEIPGDQFTQFKKSIGEVTLKNRIRDIAYKYYLKGLENRILSGCKKPDFKCTALKSYFRLNPNGEILTCSVMNKPVANLNNKDFIEVWESHRVENARNKVASCEGCWFGCEVIPNATIGGNIIEGLFYY